MTVHNVQNELLSAPIAPKINLKPLQKHLKQSQ